MTSGETPMKAASASILSPSQQTGRARYAKLRLIVVLLIVLVLLFLGLSWIYSPNRPIDYADPIEQFKYGSIGSDIENGLPLEVMRVLPRMFPQHLPPARERNYSAFGFIQEPNRIMPIGFSQRRRIIDVVGLNCAACHVGSIRKTAQATPLIYPGMPSNTVDLLRFFQFLFDCANDPLFTPEAILANIRSDRTILPP